MKKIIKPIVMILIIISIILLVFHAYFYIRNTSITKNITYEILEDESYCDIKEESYKYKKDSNIVEIYLGEKNTGGYHVNIEKIEYKNNVITITVSESSPPSGSIVTDAFTQPCLKIKLSKKANKVVVIDLAGDELKKIDNKG